MKEAAAVVTRMLTTVIFLIYGIKCMASASKDSAEERIINIQQGILIIGAMLCAIGVGL